MLLFHNKIPKLGFVLKNKKTKKKTKKAKPKKKNK